MSARAASGWLDLSGRRGVGLPQASSGPLPIVPEDLHEYVVFAERTAGPGQAVGAAGLALAGTPTGGALGAVVLWGPGVFSCRVGPRHGTATTTWRAVIRGPKPVEFTVATPAGEIRGTWAQPRLRYGWGGLRTGWTRSSLAVHATVGNLTLVLRARGINAWTITRLDGTPSARGTTGRWYVARHTDTLERSVALFTAYAVAPSSILVFGGDV